ncbi:MAG: M14 family metallopeptidase [Pyrinomonadaceae bacterium]
MNKITALSETSLRTLSFRYRPCLRAGFCNRALRLCGLFLLLALTAIAQVPAPKDTLGFTPGDDRKLASWAQTVEYFKALDKASDRVIFEEIGKTTLGAPFVYATISSPENLKNLTKYKEINDKLADPRKIGAGTLLSPRGDGREKASKQLISQGKTIVLITCGIHSTEVGSSLSSMLIAYKLASGNDAETKKILDNTIILLVPSLNPDGVDIVKNWYDKTLSTKFEGTSPPELYHKYVGHDNNRDWYFFSQVETQLTVDKIHNVWHPQIVHDIHQQGTNGARLFLPPYMQPVEPNVPKQIVEGYTELGNAMAAELRKKGLQGITTNTTYDAWTPARAYSHYHGGVRILSETASANLASPITVKFEDLRSGVGGLDPKTESDKFGPLWKGGEWKLRNITDYMTAAAFSLLGHAADNRERWLSRFYEIGKEAVRTRTEGEIRGFVIPYQGHNSFVVGEALERGGVKIEFPGKFTIEGGETYASGSGVFKLQQPYGAFATALLKPQKYPDMLDDKGQPIQPYDVTAHNLPLLAGVEVVPIYKEFVFTTKGFDSGTGSGGGGSGCKGVFIYKRYHSHQPSMDEGWTHWVIDKYGDLLPRKGVCRVDNGLVSDLELKDPDLASTVNTIVFPDQSPNQILNGFPKGAMPDEYTGGVGKEGVENLKKFVEAGGTLVFLNRASNFAIREFNLPIKDVTDGLSRKDFFIPGSILRTELDLTHPIAKGMPAQSIAWFENSPAFEVERQETGDKRQEQNQASPVSGLTSPVSAVRIVARYPSDPKKILLSGWALGAEKIAGKAALVEVTMGKGKIILFGFRPQYRGQSLATFPLLFNAISQ